MNKILDMNISTKHLFTSIKWEITEEGKHKVLVLFFVVPSVVLFFYFILFYFTRH